MIKKAIVIGASSGIGKELALILSKNKYIVGITGRREALLQDVVKNNPHSSILVKAFDCTGQDTLSHLNELVQELGGLDLLVFSSGTGDINNDLNHAIESTTNQLNVNAFTKIMGWAFLLFEQQNYGHLVAISSVAGLRGGRMAPSYNASKAYQINYLEALRQKATKSGSNISITDIRPGFVDTAMAKGDGKFWVAPPQKAAQQIYNAIKRKEDVAYITKRWRLIAVILKILPNWLYKRM